MEPAQIVHDQSPITLEWAAIARQAPQLKETMARYLTQAGTFLAPASVDSASIGLRQIARWLLAETDIRTVAGINRNAIEDYKVWLADQPGIGGRALSANTQRQRLRMLRVFFERIIEWEWTDAPARNPIIGRDIPPRPEPLPKFLDDRDAATLMAAAHASTDPRDRLVMEILSRTGMRAGEVGRLDPDAVVCIGENHWLRVPVGKLRNDRYVPLHADLVNMFATWTADNLEHIRHHRRLVVDHRGPISRFHVTRVVQRVSKRAGVKAHPHQLRHTLATQAINRGMRLEAIASLLGHRSMEMTLTYARITDRVVADEYEAISAKIDALYGQAAKLAADLETISMARLRRETHARMLGNGLCTRPVELECRMESTCETCSYFRTGPEFVPVLLRQRDHARDHNQPDRAALFDQIISKAETAP
ncbi:MAG: putative transposase [Acidimicrobiales bacterium]|nr:putative transposase [Acidimicrobiales bacterium]